MPVERVLRYARWFAGLGLFSLCGYVLMKFVLAIPDEEKYGAVAAAGITFTAAAFLLVFWDGVYKRDRRLLWIVTAVVLILTC